MIHIITVATHKYGYFDYLVESCRRHGKSLIVLGYGEPWQGFNWRYTLVLEYIKSLSPHDIVCFVDGYDVLCTRNLQELGTEFVKLRKKYACKIIVGEHKIRNESYEKVMDLLLKTYFSTCKDKALNAGTYIGYCHDLLEILTQVYAITSDHKSDDQVLFTKYCQGHEKDIHIDSQNELFLTIANPYRSIDEYLEFEHGRLKYNNQYPFFVHGPGETYLDNIIINLGYPYHTKVCDELAKHYYHKLYFRWKNSTIMIPILIIIIFVVFIMLIRTWAGRHRA
jgi:hypothetical protein